MKQLTYPRELYDETALQTDIIQTLIKRHEGLVPRLKKLKDYYLGEHVILQHKRRSGQPNFKPVCNHAKDIADTSTGYFMGNAIKYTNTSDGDIERLLLAFDGAEVDQVDGENALNMAIYGLSYELVYAKEGENELAVRVLEPENTFLVYDDSIERSPLFAVYYYTVVNDLDNTKIYRAVVLTQSLHYSLTLKEGEAGELSEPKEHGMGGIPVVEYRNNNLCIGDYEQQLGLIDAYNSLMGNRVNDKEQAIESILTVYGTSLADTPEDAKEAMQILREEGLLELPEASKAEFLTNTLDESSVEVLRKALKEDIYTFSHVPNLTDEKFAGNTSGVAMEFKLLGLEMITKIKQRQYVQSLHKRIRLFAYYYNLTTIYDNARAIVPNFSRGLPKNLLELSQIISNLNDKVSLRQLISLLPFVEDPDAEIEALEEQKQRNKEAAFGFDQQIANHPIEEELDE